MKRLNYKRAGTFTAGLIIVLFVILNTAHNAHGDGEIILCPGDKYAIPCLAQLLPGQEYEIEIENPDIVGLDETGKSIVAIAAGTTEVTVRLMNPDAGYLYVFAVADVFAQPATGIYDEPEKDYVYEQYTDEMGAYGWDSENVSEPYEYDGVSPSSQGNGTGRTNNEPGADAHVGTGQGAGVDTDKDADSGTERGAGGDRDLDADAGTEQSAGIDTDKDADVGTEQRAGTDTDKDADAGTKQGAGGDTDRDADAGTEQRAGTDTDKDADAGTEQGSDHDTNGSDDMSRNYLRYPPVTFTHGTGKYDILLPPHYTLWICAHSEGPVSVLYVGVNGVPVRYHTVKNMILICSDDLPSGNCRIQVIAADAAGRVSVLEQYGAARQALDISDKFTMLNDGK